MKKIEISEGLVKELNDIKKSMSTWTIVPVSMETVVKTIIQYYYLSIGYPPSLWNKPIKGDPKEILEMKYIIKYKKSPTEKELEQFAKKGYN